LHGSGAIDQPQLLGLRRWLGLEGLLEPALPLAELFEGALGSGLKR
jgi:hypothetical protein